MPLVIPQSPLLDGMHERIHEIGEAARPRYRTDILFHPFTHAEATTSHWLVDFVSFRENGIGPDEVDLESGVAATYFHDVDYGEPFVKFRPFRSKEARSIAFAKIALPGIGFTPPQIEWTAEGIRPTEAGIPAETTFEKSVVRADVHNVQGPYDSFVRLFVLNVRELVMLGVAKSNQFNDAKMRGVEKLHQYFDQDLRYSFEKDDHYNRDGLRNIDELEGETQSSIEDRIGEPFYLDEAA